MDRKRAASFAACFSGFFAIVGCGDASAPRIDGPGAHGSGTDPSAAADGGAPEASAPALQAYCTPPNMLCNGLCRAVSSDPGNCGACGNTCLGGDSICIAGSCSCSGAGLDYCAGVGCMDVSSDFGNCGACGHACDPNNDQACASGQCVPND
jgi:hypothetical protein